MPTQATLTTLSNVLKEFYLPPVVEQLNNKVLLWSRLEKSSEELYGNQAVVPLHTNRTSGIGPAAEGTPLPAAGAQGYAKAVYDLKPQYGRIQVTGFAIEKTGKDSGAFLRALKSEVDGLRTDLGRDLARQAYGDGTGQIAQCGTTSSSATIVLNAVSGAEAIRKGHFYVGMKVDIGTTADSRAIAENSEITAVTLGTPSITISSSVSTTGSHYVSRAYAAAGTTTRTTVAGEVLGLQGLVPTSANEVGGINAGSAGNEYWDNLRDTSTATLTSDALVQNMNKVEIAGGEISAMVSSYGIQRKLFGLLQSQVRYVDPLKIEGGFKTLEFNGKSFIADKDAPFGKIYLLDEKFIKVFRNRDWHWLDEDGNILKWVTGYDAWEGVLAVYHNLGISRRNTQLVMSNLAADDPNGF